MSNKSKKSEAKVVTTTKQITQSLKEVNKKNKLSNDDRLELILKHVHENYIHKSIPGFSYDLFLKSLKDMDLITQNFLKKDEKKKEAEKLKIYNVELPKFYFNQYYEDTKNQLKEEYPEAAKNGLALLKHAKVKFDALSVEEKEKYVTKYIKELEKYKKDQQEHNPYLKKGYKLEINTKNGKPKLIFNPLADNEVEAENESETDVNESENQESNEENNNSEVETRRKSLPREAKTKANEQIKNSAKNTRSKKNKNAIVSDVSESENDETKITSDSNENNDEDNNNDEEIKEIIEKNKVKSQIKHKKPPKLSASAINLENYT